MRFTNCRDVKIKDIQDGRVYVEQTSKSGKRISVPIHKKLKALIEKYYNPDSEFLFEFARLSSYNQICNPNLKKISLICGIQKHITFHISRHSFANNMKSKGVNINSIKDSLGHGDLKITEDYLKELDDSFLDEDLMKLYE